MNAMPLSQFPNRQVFQSPIPTDLLEQLHARPRHFRPPRRQNRCEDRSQDGANICDDTPPHQQTRSPPRRGQNSRRQPAEPGPS
jgi:hypothetical protein